MNRLAVLFAAAVVPLAGCAGISFLVASFAKPPKVDALYELPKNKRVLVLTEDMSAPVNYPPLKRILSAKISERLMAKNLAAETIDFERVLDLQSRNRTFDRLGIVQIGSALQADVVVYVDISEFRLKETVADSFWRGRLSAFVRVIDVHENKRLWPAAPLEGHLASVQSPMMENDSAAFGTELSEMLATALADKISKLFYEHRPDSFDPAE